MDPKIVIVGLGPGPVALLTREAEEVLLGSRKIFYPVYHWLEEQGKDVLCFDVAYTIPGMGYEDLYALIAQAILREVELHDRAVYALPGNPYVFERTTRLIDRRARQNDIACKIIPGMSFLELIYTELAIDPAQGLQIVTPGALHPSQAQYSEHLGLLIGLIGHSATPDPNCEETNVETVSRLLLARYPPDHEVSLVWTDGMPDYETRSQTFPLRELIRHSSQTNFFASLYVPPVPPRHSERNAPI